MSATILEAAKIDALLNEIEAISSNHGGREMYRAAVQRWGQEEIRRYREIAGCALNGTDEADELAALPHIERERETYRRKQARILDAMKGAFDAARASATQPEKKPVQCVFRSGCVNGRACIDAGYCTHGAQMLQSMQSASCEASQDVLLKKAEQLELYEQKKWYFNPQEYSWLAQQLRALASMRVPAEVQEGKTCTDCGEGPHPDGEWHKPGCPKI